MSQTTVFGDGALLERLTNEEFLTILQHLSLEQYVLTEVFIPKKKWIHLLDVNLQTLQIKCGACDKQVRFEDVKCHLVLDDHLIHLRSNVKQFYHPFYTYGKIDIKLARGEHVSPDLQENALREVTIQSKGFKKNCLSAKQFSEIIDRRSQGIEEKQLIEANLGKKIFSPDDMIVTVNLPFDDIPKLMFCIVNYDWQTVFAYKNLTKKTTFHCKICSISCCGIETLNSHLYGYTHKLKQLELSALSYKNSSKVNKNCCIQFSDSFSFSIKNNAKKNYSCCREINSDLWIAKLPKKIAKKVKPLNKILLQIFASSDNSTNQNHTNKGWENIEKFELIDNLGHIGVEYVLKIIKHDNDREPKFECGLCEFVGDKKKMQRHILSFDHKKKYLDLHYCDTVKKYESLIGNMCYEEFQTVMNEVVHKVAIEIEKHHSRSLPYTVMLADYKARRPVLIAKVYSLLHASQLRGPSFSNIVSKEKIRYLKNSARELAHKAYVYPEYVLFTEPPKTKTYLNQINQDPVIRLREYNAKCNKNLLARADSPIRDQIHKIESKYGLQLEREASCDHRSISRSPIPGKSKLQSPDRAFYLWNERNQNIWDIYRREISLAANEIEIAYSNYRKNPESHPLYEDEWNNFWQRRKIDLEREGYDHHSHNFQPEWVQYFKKRIELLFGEALHKSQINIRYRLNIPLGVEEDCQQPAEFFDNYHQRRIGIGNEDNSDFKEKKRQFSPTSESWDLQNKKMCLEEIRDLKIINPQMIVSKINDSHSNVIHVLRLMTALEEHLGSLGEKVIHLLSSALQLEMYFSGNDNEFEARVLTNENCNLLETAMEKLKGILFADLLEEKKVIGFNRVITYTSNLLTYAEKMGWRQGDNLLNKKRCTGMERTNQGQLPDLRVGNYADDTKLVTEKSLSDTLMDMAKIPQARSKQTYEKFGNRLKKQLQLPDCPAPHSIKETNMDINLFSEFKGQPTKSSGLAAFDTNLSLDEAYSSRRNRWEIGQLQSRINIVGNNVYNNSFKNNNETRTNSNSRTNTGTSLQF